MSLKQNRRFLILEQYIFNYLSVILIVNLLNKCGAQYKKEYVKWDLLTFGFKNMRWL